MRRIENRKNRLMREDGTSRIDDINHRRSTYKQVRGQEYDVGHSIARRVASSGQDLYTSFVACSVFTRGDKRGER